MPIDPASPGKAGNFATTRWTLVLAAGRQGSAASEQALAYLCEAYWYPLYAFVRRSGHPAEDARDLTQAFFATLLEKNYLGAADPERGHFRSFLLTAVKHFLSKQRERERAQKRGGGRPLLPLDFAKGEERYRREPTHEVTAERLYEQHWAIAVIERVLDQLRERYRQAGNEALFERLKDHLTGQETGRSYREIAGDLGVSEATYKMSVHRARRRFREMLLAEIAQTVETPADVESELRDLFQAVRKEGH